MSREILKIERLQNPPLDELLKAHGLEQADVVLMGDGAGTGWSIGAGWGCLIIERVTGDRKVVAGGMTSGTVYIGEIMAYVHSMMLVDGVYWPVYQSRGKGSPNVAVFTDSSSVATMGNRLMTDDPKSAMDSNPLFAALYTYVVKGYRFKFTHWPRDTMAGNSIADILSYRARLANQIDVDITDEAGEIADLFGIHPQASTPSRPTI